MPQTNFSHETYLSPFTWRYGTAEMRQIWSEENKHKLWRQIWVALAKAQQSYGLVTADQVADLEANIDNIDIDRATEIEHEIRHDLMAAIRTYAEQCPVGGGVIHLGATSMDIEDNADAMRVRDALAVIIEKLTDLLSAVVDQIDKWVDTPAMAFTHIQPAEPTTIGYRIAQYGQDLLRDLDELKRVHAMVLGKGIKGAVGTSASYAVLIGAENVADLEAKVLAEIDLPAFDAATQTYPRKQDYFIVSALAGLAASLHKLTYDLRILQNPLFGEWSEPFGAKQVGSSAMPFKRNPISSEKVGSLARYLATLPRVAWDDAAGSVLERTLDDSANRRVLLPSAFLAADEMLRVVQRIVKGLVVNEVAVARNMATYGPFAATEKVLMAAVMNGGDRQELHEVIRECSLAAWADLSEGKANPLADVMAAHPELTKLLSADEIRSYLDATSHVGDAPVRARTVATSIRAAIA